MDINDPRAPLPLSPLEQAFRNRLGIINRTGAGEAVSAEELTQADRDYQFSGGEFVKGLRRAAYSAGEATKAAYGQLQELSNPEEGLRTQRAAAQSIRDMPQAWAPQVAESDDVHSVADFANYAAGKVGEGAMTSGMALAGTALGGALGGARGALVGGTAPLIPMEAGGQVLDTLNDPVAMQQPAWKRAAMAGAVGAGNAYIENINERALVLPSLLGKGITSGAGLGNAFKTVGLATLRSAAGEGMEEGLQDLTGQTALKALNPQSQYDFGQTKEAMIGGAIGGAPMGTMGGAAQAARDNTFAAVAPPVNKTARSFDALFSRLQNSGELGEDLKNMTLGAISKAGEGLGYLRGEGLDNAEKFLGKTAEDVNAFVAQHIKDPEIREKFTQDAASLGAKTATDWATYKLLLKSATGQEFMENAGMAAGVAKNRIANEAPRIFKWTSDAVKGLFKDDTDQKASMEGFKPEPILNGLKAVHPALKDLIEQKGSTIIDKRDLAQLFSMAASDPAQYTPEALERNPASANIAKAWEDSTGTDLFSVINAYNNRENNVATHKITKSNIEALAVDQKLGTEAVPVLQELAGTRLEDMSDDQAGLLEMLASKTDLSPEELYAHLSVTSDDALKQAEQAKAGKLHARDYSAAADESSVDTDGFDNSGGFFKPTESDELLDESGQTNGLYDQDGNKVDLEETALSPFNSKTITESLADPQYNNSKNTQFPVRVSGEGVEEFAKELGKELNEDGSLSLDINPMSLTNMAATEDNRGAFHSYLSEYNEKQSPDQNAFNRYGSLVATLADLGIDHNGNRLKVEVPEDAFLGGKVINNKGGDPFTIRKATESRKGGWPTSAKLAQMSKTADKFETLSALNAEIKNVQKAVNSSRAGTKKYAKLVGQLNHLNSLKKGIKDEKAFAEAKKNYPKKIRDTRVREEDSILNSAFRSGAISEQGLQLIGHAYNIQDANLESSEILAREKARIEAGKYTDEEREELATRKKNARKKSPEQIEAAFKKAKLKDAKKEYDTKAIDSKEAATGRQILKDLGIPMIEGRRNFDLDGLLSEKDVAELGSGSDSVDTAAGQDPTADERAAGEMEEYRKTPMHKETAARARANRKNTKGEKIYPIQLERVDELRKQISEAKTLKDLSGIKLSNESKLIPEERKELLKALTDKKKELGGTQKQKQEQKPFFNPFQLDELDDEGLLFEIAEAIKNGDTARLEALRAAQARRQPKAPAQEEKQEQNSEAEVVPAKKAREELAKAKTVQEVQAVIENIKKTTQLRKGTMQQLLSMADKKIAKMELTDRRYLAKAKEIVKEWIAKYAPNMDLTISINREIQGYGQQRFDVDTNKNYIELNPTRLRGLRTATTLAHEFGHALMYHIYLSADQSVKDAIYAQYEADLAAFNSGSQTLFELGEKFSNPAAMQDIMNSSKMDEVGSGKKFAEANDARNKPGYTLSFSEWFANQFAKHAVQEKVAGKVSVKEAGFWNKVTAKMRQFFDDVIAVMQPSTTFKQWVDSLAAANDQNEQAPPGGGEPTNLFGEQGEGEEEGEEAPPGGGEPTDLFGNEPPKPPKSPKKGSKKGPWEYSKAQKAFIARVEKLLGHRVAVQFEQVLENQAKGEYVNIKEAIENVTNERRNLVKELKQKPEDRESKLTDAQLKAGIDRLLNEEERLTKDQALLGVIKLAAGAEKNIALADHEPVHAAFQFFFSTDERRILATAFTQGPVAKKLRDYFKNDKAVLKQLENGEEAAAYGFQLWVADPSILKVGPKTEGLFQKIKDWIYSILSIMDNNMKAEMIMQDFASGERAKRGATPLQRVLDRNMTSGEKALKVGKDALLALEKLYDVIFTSVYNRLNNSTIPPLARIAQLGYQATGMDGNESGMVQRMRNETQAFQNRISKILGDLTEEQQLAVHDALIAGRIPTNDPLVANRAKALRTFYSQVLAYQKDAGVILGEIKNYYPLAFDPEKVAADKEGFLKMLNQPKYKQYMDTLMKTPDELYNSIVSYLERGEDLVNVMGDENEPMAAHTRTRTLGFLDAADRRKFMEDDPVHTATRYIKQAVRQAEFVRTFGNGGKKFNALIKEAQDRYGATPDDLALAKNYLDGLMGNKEIGMSREMKDLMGVMTTYQNIRLLPLAIFSSLVDPLGIAIRTNSVTAGWDAFTYSLKNMFKEWHGEYTRDQWEQIAQDWGIIADSGTVINAYNRYDGITMSGKLKDINDKFFKVNLLSGWIRNNTIMAVRAANTFLQRSSEDFFGKEQSARYLEELGLEKPDIMFDENLDRLALTADEIKALNPKMTMKQAKATEAKLRNAMEKIVHQSLLNPSSAELPAWASNPYLALISHLKQFVWSFQAVIIDRLTHEMSHGNFKPVLIASLYVPGMIAADFAKDMIANSGEEPPYKKDWGAVDYMKRGVERSGLTGVGQFFIDSQQDVDWGGGGYESFAGPTLGQMRKGLKAVGSDDPESMHKWIVEALPAYKLYDQWL
jgi:hypothetical protein